MAKAVFTTSVFSEYDDLPEVKYHFPKRYLKAAKKTVGDFVAFFEPKKGGGRQRYYAIAIVDRIEEDQKLKDHYYARIRPGSYIDFVSLVPFKEDSFYYESILKKDDGTTNSGSFGWSIRLVSDNEFEMIVQAGFANLHILDQPKTEVLPDMVHEETVQYDRPIISQLVNRKYRDPVFKEIVRNAYQETCAITGLKLINGGGACEIEAAHIMPVQAEGPDSIRNGIALSRTAHWLFDRGVISLEDNGKILHANEYLSDDLKRLLKPNGFAQLPQNPQNTPHHLYLEYHRDVVFKG